MKFPRSQSIAEALALSLLLACSCGQKGEPGPIAQGEKAVDRDRAFRRLADLGPAPEFPIATSQPSSQPPAAATRSFRRGEKSFNEQLWSEAISSLERAVQAEPGLVEAWLLLARAHIQQGSLTMAGTQLGEALKRDPQNLAAHQLLGEIAWRENRTDDAIREFRLALRAGEKSPDSPELVLSRLSLAMALRKQGYLTAAVEQLEAYLLAVEKPTPAMTQYRELADTMALYRGKAAGLIGEIRTELGQHDLAAKAYEQAVAQTPSEPSLRVRLAESLARAGKADEAMKVVSGMLNDWPEDPAGLALLTRVCEILKQPQRYDEEIVRLARSVTSPTVRMQLADLLLQRKQTGPAIEVLEVLVTANPSESRTYYQLAGLYVEQRQIDKALTTLAQALREHPESYEQVDKTLGSEPALAASAELLSKARQLQEEKPKDAVAIYLVGRMLERGGKTEEAAEAYESARAADASFGPAWAGIVRMAGERRQWEKVISAAEQAINHSAKSAEIYLLKGRAHEALDEDEKAESALLEAFRLDRKRADALFELALAAERRSDVRRCEQLYRRILDEVDPKFRAARERLVRLFLNTNRQALAKEYFSDFARLEQEGPGVLRCKALLDLSQSKAVDGTKRLEEYRAALEKIAREYPNDPDTQFDLAVSEATVGNAEEALGHVEAALKLAPNDLRMRETAAMLQCKLLRFDEAGKIYRALVRERPRDVNYQRHLLEVAVNQADYEGAIKLLRQMLERKDLKDAREGLRQQLINFLTLAEHYDEAVAAAREAIKDEPSDWSRRQVLLAVLNTAKRYDDAVDETKEWLDDEEFRGRARGEHVRELMLADRTFEAQRRVLAWLAAEPDDVEMNYHLIRLFLKEKDWESAIEAARTGLEQLEHQAIYSGLLAQGYEMAGKLDEAAKLYRERWKAGGLTADQDLVRVYVAAKRFRDAERFINGVLTPQLQRAQQGESFDPELVVRMRMHLANLYSYQDREPAAIEQLEEIRKLKPLDPELNNNLGYTLADAGLRLDEAEKMVRWAVGEKPRQAAYLDSLGWVLYKKKDFSGAIQYLERAIKMREDDDPVFFDHLGDAQYRLGRTDESLKSWEKARELMASRETKSLSPQEARLAENIKTKIEQHAENRKVDVAVVAGEAPTSRPTEIEEKVESKSKK